jgi:hypothetical protein
MNKSAVLAVCMCAAMVAGGMFIATPVKAGDTSNTLVVDIRGAASPPFITQFNDVAWTPDGKYALFVGTNTVQAAAWWYDPTKTGDSAWTPAILAVGNPVATTFLAVEWDPDNSYMTIIGDALGGYWYHAARGGNLVEENDVALSVYIEDLSYSAGKMFAVGRSGIQGYAFVQYTATHNWSQLSGSIRTATNWYAGAIYSGKLYAAGNDGSSTCLYGSYLLPSGPWTIYDSGKQFVYTDMVVDTSNATAHRMLLTVAGRISTQFAVYQARGTNLTVVNGLVSVSTTSLDLKAIDIDSSGFAVAVGQNLVGPNGLVYDIWRVGSTTYSSMRGGSGGVYTAGNFKGVAVRPTGVQMALIAGSSLKYSYTSVLAPIQVDTAVPHIDYVDIYPAGTSTASSVLNSQVDVDIGDSLTRYTLETRIYDNLGVARMTTLEAWLWFDDAGVNFDLPTAMGATFDNVGGENKRMHFSITSAGVATQLYPATGAGEETSLISGSWTPIDATSAWVRITFSPHQQVRYAPGAPGFVEAAGGRYGGGVSQGQSTINALNAINTWDLKVTVGDDAPTRNYASAYDEFGFYKYTYLSTSGIPNGGAVYGSGAPNTANVVMTPSGSNVVFAANCLYGLSVQLMTDLIGVAVPANIISASQVRLQGGAIAVPTLFLATGSTQTLIGPAQAPLNSLRTTTTSSWDGNAVTLEPVRWWVDIPLVPEDSYVSQLLWSITN